MSKHKSLASPSCVPWIADSAAGAVPARVEPVHDVHANFGVDVGWIKISLAALVLAGTMLAIGAAGRAASTASETHLKRSSGSPRAPAS
ncbi:hypothetical protein [Azospirillum sp. TSA6c]|uniref:hypothetical protein n=1 Tax=unclassified Azospirillum TaxID=2630922 RepID=UPI0018EEBCBF|nr:hypothetical protein [Azospirillum sp. TSA6c]